jgi:hypothetical protein
VREAQSIAQRRRQNARDLGKRGLELAMWTTGRIHGGGQDVDETR